MTSPVATARRSTVGLGALGLRFVLAFAVLAFVGQLVAVSACSKEETEGGGGQPATTTEGGGGAGGLGGDGGMGGEGGDGGTPEICEEDPCKLTSPQCGCAEGERCHLPSVAAQCWPEGDVEVGQYCSNDCEAGYRCWGLGGDPICRAYCEDDSDCLPPGGRCVVELFSGVAKLCTENCDAITSTGCKHKDPGLKCALNIDSNQMVFSYCTDAGEKGQDEPCGSASQCAAGMTCIGSSQEPGNFCRTWCDYPSAILCPEDHGCASITPPLTIGQKQYGVCIPLPS